MDKHFWMNSIENHRDKKNRRIVVKLGTSVLTGGSHTLDEAHMAELTRQCATLHRAGYEVVICSSGSIAVGRSRLDFPDLPPTIRSKQIFAAIGQSRLIQTWEKLFEKYQIHVGQILLTRADVEDRRRFLNARDTLSGLLEQGIIPIVNENDAVATEEIRLGDNDNLSALVSTLVGANLLIILTDQPGLFTADPRSNPDAQRIETVHTIDEELMRLAGGSSTGLGVGGMQTKLQAAQIARHAGVDVVIADGSAVDIVLRVANKRPVGTHFPAQATSLESRKIWILAGHKPPTGKIQIDAGAVQALCHQGKSLLPAGVKRIYGKFQRGDTVGIIDEQMREIARGIVAYGSDALQLIRGSQSKEIPQKLGYTYGSVAVHRNDMVLLNE